MESLLVTERLYEWLRLALLGRSSRVLARSDAFLAGGARTRLGLAFVLICLIVSIVLMCSQVILVGIFGVDD